MSVRVGIIYGSASDHDKMVKAAAILERFGVGFEIEAMSAHRSPDRVHEYATTNTATRGRPSASVRLCVPARTIVPIATNAIGAA